MNQGLQIMQKEFPVIELKDSFQIMFEGLTPTQKEAIHKELAEFDGVVSVDSILLDDEEVTNITPDVDGVLSLGELTINQTVV
jgi:hypothetical protein